MIPRAKYLTIIFLLILLIISVSTNWVSDETISATTTITTTVAPPVSIHEEKENKIILTIREEANDIETTTTTTSTTSTTTTTETPKEFLNYHFHKDQSSSQAQNPLAKIFECTRRKRNNYFWSTEKHQCLPLLFNASASPSFELKCVNDDETSSANETGSFQNNNNNGNSRRKNFEYITSPYYFSDSSSSFAANLWKPWISEFFSDKNKKEEENTNTAQKQESFYFKSYHDPETENLFRIENFCIFPQRKNAKLGGFLAKGENSEQRQQVFHGKEETRGIYHNLDKFSNFLSKNVEDISSSSLTTEKEKEKEKISSLAISDFIQEEEETDVIFFPFSDSSSGLRGNFGHQFYRYLSLTGILEKLMQGTTRNKNNNTKKKHKFLLVFVDLDEEDNSSVEEKRESNKNNLNAWTFFLKLLLVSFSSSSHHEASSSSKVSIPWIIISGNNNNNTNEKTKNDSSFSSSSSSSSSKFSCFKKGIAWQSSYFPTIKSNNNNNNNSNNNSTTESLVNLRFLQEQESYSFGIWQSISSSSSRSSLFFNFRSNLLVNCLKIVSSSSKLLLEDSKDSFPKILRTPRLFIDFRTKSRSILDFGLFYETVFKEELKDYVDVNSIMIDEIFSSSSSASRKNQNNFRSVIKKLHDETDIFVGVHGSSFNVPVSVLRKDSHVIEVAAPFFTCDNNPESDSENFLFTKQKQNSSSRCWFGNFADHRKLNHRLVFVEYSMGLLKFKKQQQTKDSSTSSSSSVDVVDILSSYAKFPISILIENIKAASCEYYRKTLSLKRRRDMQTDYYTRRYNSLCVNLKNTTTRKFQFIGEETVSVFEKNDDDKNTFPKSVVVRYTEDQMKKHYTNFIVDFFTVILLNLAANENRKNNSNNININKEQIKIKLQEIASEAVHELWFLRNAVDYHQHLFVVGFAHNNNNIWKLFLQHFMRKPVEPRIFDNQKEFERKYYSSKKGKSKSKSSFMKLICIPVSSLISLKDEGLNWCLFADRHRYSRPMLFGVMDFFSSLFTP